MGKIPRETAIGDIDAWLDKKKISQSLRDSRKESVETLYAAVEEGSLVVDQENDFVLVLTLGDPVLDDKKQPMLTELKFKSRLSVKELQSYLKGVASDDGDGRMRAHVCALTKQNGGLILGMDTNDYRVAMAIAIFFV